MPPYYIQFTSQECLHSHPLQLPSHPHRMLTTYPVPPDINMRKLPFPVQHPECF